MVRRIRAKLILQLRAEGLSGRAIAASQSISRNSIRSVLDAADRPDDEVYELLFPGRGQLLRRGIW